MALNLRPYGINLTLEPTMSELDSHLTSGILIAKAFETIDTIKIDDVVYEKEGNSLGTGSYGKTYKCRSPDGNPVAIKAILKPLDNKDDIQGFLTEIIIQIILMETSKDQPNGPYVPKIYKIGFNKSNKKGYIVSELMYRTVNSLVGTESKESNNLIVPEMLKQVATILEFFGEKLQFNHRDFKSDNIMYIKNKEGYRFYKIIDFGYSCLKWNNLQITGIIPKFSGVCFRKGRDLTQLMYELWKYYQLSKELYAWLYSNLQVHINKDCSIVEGCKIAGLPIQSWQNTYTMLNKGYIEPIYNTHTVLERVKRLQGNKEFMKQKNNPVVVPAPAPVIVVPQNKQCPPGKIFNPKTGRCVKEDGWAGKQIKGDLAAAAKEAAAKEAAAKEAAAKLQAVPVKTCPPDKVLNPKTLRCVKADGWAGKHIKNKTRKNK